MTTGDKMDFLNSPEQNLRTWDKIWKLMIGAAGATLVLLLLLGAIFL